MASIQILRSDGQRARPDTVSGTDGGYRYDSLPQGDYIISATVDGYQPARQKLTMSCMGGTDARFDVLMSKIGSMGPTRSASMHQPDVPEKALASFNKGLEMMGKQSDFKGGVAQFQQAIAEFPNYYEAYAQMGIAQVHLNDLPSAEAALRKSVELSSSKYPSALLLLAELLNGQKRYTDAEPFARQAVALDDASWHAHYDLALALVGLKRGLDAEPDALKADKLNPNNAEIQFLLLNVHLQTHNYPSALKDAEAYLKLDPNGPYSDPVRKKRDQLQQALQGAQNQPAPAAAKP